jgi:GrpB-like predicted nucleotidyltransferase (UPF0157 family)
VPFSDEVRSVEVIGYQERWSGEFAKLAQELRRLELAEQGAIEHIGSTAVPGLAARDVTDIQIRVPSIDDQRMTIAFERNGYRRRPESWNNLEATRTGDIPKLVFAPPPERPLLQRARANGRNHRRLRCAVVSRLPPPRRAAAADLGAVQGRVGRVARGGRSVRLRAGEAASWPR